MRSLFFDTETNGLPKNRFRGALEGDGNWPDLVSIAWQVWIGENKIVEEYHIIRPCFEITEDSSRIHGITQEIAEREGKELSWVMDRFMTEVSKIEEEKTGVIVAHHLEFDKNVVFHALRWRLHRKVSWPSHAEFCTMKQAMDEMKLPYKTTGRYSKNRVGFKPPTLTELYYDQFGRGFDGAHHAGRDVEVLAEIVRARWDIL